MSSVRNSSLESGMTINDRTAGAWLGPLSGPEDQEEDCQAMRDREPDSARLPLVAVTSASRLAVGLFKKKCRAGRSDSCPARRHDVLLGHISIKEPPGRGDGNALGCAEPGSPPAKTAVRDHVVATQTHEPDVLRRLGTLAVDHGVAAGRPAWHCTHRGSVDAGLDTNASKPYARGAWSPLRWSGLVSKARLAHSRCTKARPAAYWNIWLRKPPISDDAIYRLALLSADCDLCRPESFRSAIALIEPPQERARGVARCSKAIGIWH